MSDKERMAELEQKLIEKDIYYTRKLAEQQAKNAIMREYCWLEHKKLFGKEFDVGEPEELINLLAKAKEEGRKEVCREFASRVNSATAIAASAPKPQGETK